MEILKIPAVLENKGIQGWPKIALVGEYEQAPEGIPFIRAKTQDFALVFRVLIPMLKKRHPMFNWEEVYQQVTGNYYKPVHLYEERWSNEAESRYYKESSSNECSLTLEEMTADFSSSVDLNVLMQLKMIPTFMDDIAKAIRINITNEYAWHDGYNKKLGICSGYLEQQPRQKSLVILDISSSIPSGLSAGMMTLIQTITEITHADLILTGGQSYFYTNQEVRQMDIHKERKRISRSNESKMFENILLTHDLNYANVIAFGDSDTPQLDYQRLEHMSDCNIKKFYSFFVAEYDRYHTHYSTLAGYGKWVRSVSPNAEVIHNYKWARCFNYDWE